MHAFLAPASRRTCVRPMSSIEEDLIAELDAEAVEEEIDAAAEAEEDMKTDTRGSFKNGKKKVIFQDTTEDLD